MTKRAPNLLGRLSVASGESNHVSPPMTSAVRHVSGPDSRPKFKCRFKNQNRFLDGGAGMAGKLSPSVYKFQRAIFYQYAEFLEMCGLIEWRVELLKQIAGFPDQMSGFGVSTSGSFALDETDLHVDTALISTGPQLTFECPACGRSTDLIRGGRCRDCSSQQKPLVCLLCESIVAGLSVPCLQCGHFLHLACRRLLVQRLVDSGGANGSRRAIRRCIPGCDCDCDCATTWGFDIEPLPWRE